MTENPLEESDPASIEELFRRDPLDLSDQDVGAICRELRRQRTEFQKEENRKKSQGKKSKPTDSGGISLDDLEGSLE